MTRVRIAAVAVCWALTGCHTATKNIGFDSGAPDGGLDLASDLAVVADMTGKATDMSSPDTHQALKLLPNAVPTSVDGGVDYYDVHVEVGSTQSLPGAATPIWGFNGQWPGPTIRATMGRPVKLRIHNDLPVAENITIHNHGHNSQAAFDGHPSNNTIAQGSYYDYSYPNMQQGGTSPNYAGAGTYFFHDHEMGLTAPHFYKGLEAFYVIEPAAGSTEAALNLPSGDYDIPLMIQDRTFNSDNTLVTYAPNVVPGFIGSTLVVNGTAHPFLNVARRKYRFRLLNGANARIFTVGLSKGDWAQISTDGGLLPSPLRPAPTLSLAPAERADVVIDFSQYQIGDTVTLTNADLTSPQLPEILQFRVASNATETSALPSALNSSFVRYTATTPSALPTPRPVVFDQLNGEWRMNGHTYDSSQVEFSNVKLNTVEEWVITNNSNIPHPFHQHLVQFQVLTVCPNSNTSCGSAPPLAEQGWKDTVLVAPETTVVIKMLFYYSGTDAFTGGNYVFHCHNLDHEDHAMMLQQTISK